jgi:hypothetical protein
LQTETPNKIKERAARFGMPEPSNDKKNLKRPAAQADVVDTEELEKRRKRAERFGFEVRTLYHLSFIYSLNSTFRKKPNLIHILYLFN